MKIALCSQSDLMGGAAKAAYRLHKGLIECQLDSTMIVSKKGSDDFTVLNPPSKIEKMYAAISAKLDYLPLKRYPKRTDVFSISWMPDVVDKTIRRISPDIVHLHWINGGFIRIESLKQIKKPIVWTLHDMWGFTGGCHYAGDCQGFKDVCGKCPALNSSRSKDLSTKIWRRKHRHWSSLQFAIVSPSKWLADCARQSSLFKNHRIEVIPYNIDINVFKPIDKTAAREILNLPKDKMLISFGAMGALNDHRKGSQYLFSALQKVLEPGRDELEVIVFGASKPRDAIKLGATVHYLGRLMDEYSLALVYSASDLFIAPSVQDNLPLTIMESMSCGTPVVAFRVGGIQDMIDHKINGYLANPFEIDDLAEGVRFVIKDEDRYKELSKNARRKVLENYQTKQIVSKYKSLYEDLLQ